jgi:prepilin-type N-terminal cleavage/methylation domain-containing protein
LPIVQEEGVKMSSLSFRLKGEILQPITVHKIPRRCASRNDTRHIFSKLAISQKGFTLIEIIASIVVMVIIAVIAGMGLVEISKGYVFSKKNAVATQQGQIAVERLKRELSSIKSISNAGLTTITYKSTRNLSEDVSICWAGGSAPVLIKINATDCTGGDKLVDDVTLFNLKYYDAYNSSATAYSSTTSMIEMTLQLKGAENAAINVTDRVNLYLETGG